MKSARSVVRDGTYIYKRPNINRLIPKINSLKELKKQRRGFSRDEYYCLYQTFLELDVFNRASWQERNFLAPPLKVFYDNKNVPTVMFPYIRPLKTQEEATYIEEDDCLNVIQKELFSYGLTDEQIENIITQVSNICSNFSLQVEDIFCDLSNCGFDSRFGFRVLDYGIDEEYIN